MAKKITITQQKGGAGKTTLTSNIGVCLAYLGYKVLLIDTDPQKTLSMWIEVRKQDAPILNIDLIETNLSAHLEEIVLKNDAQYDFILIDTPPHASEKTQKIIDLSDFLAIPAQLSPPDIWASQPILDMASSSTTPHFIILNRVPASGRISNDLYESLQESKLPMAQTRIGNRNHFIESFLYGLGVVELSLKIRASEEILALTKEILTFINLKQELKEKHASIKSVKANAI